jgi:hypothetical protein
VVFLQHLAVVRTQKLSGFGFGFGWETQNPTPKIQKIQNQNLIQTQNQFFIWEFYNNFLIFQTNKTKLSIVKYFIYLLGFSYFLSCITVK